ncbi:MULTISPECIES: CobW family GTP-binding protein [unclassified Delftia]|uniref:CobW family GTP-binding protein n=1 Tax=unclassified Delftia TaxID=2613839 RepID=UPI0018FFEB30|nr:MULTISPECIES: GTP-binding protein [unclassified Delftia]MBK0114523.1 GTP-binding protein [Delftia sp. S65]MBK0116594.1 GTP-binding protein [Delftia sp. S67]MBK0131767.1 GTP-binding protein [Delftia sp. S66]
MSTPAVAAQRAPIPMVVVGGYLGAGKTTMLNRLLERADGLRVAVLVNDFGEINIDAALIRTRSSDVLQLENGCICCSIGGRLAEALAAVGARPDRPDLLVIEASGVSDPVRIAQVGMLDPALQLNAILVAVDVQDVDEQLRDPLVGDMVRRQIAGATALVLTKADLASAPMTGKARQRLAEIAPHTMVLTAQCGEIPLAVFLDAVPLPRQPQHPQRLLGALAGEGGAWKRAVDGSASLAGMAGITSFSYTTHRQFDKQRLRQALRTLPVPLLRAKGIVRLRGQQPLQEIHVVGGRLRVADLGAAQVAGSAFVFIGCFTAAGQQAIRGQLDAALAPE